MVNRRQFVKGASTVGMAGLAGCLPGQGGQETETEPPMTETETTAGGGMTETETSTPQGPTPNQNEIHILTDYSNEGWQKTWENSVVPNFQDETGISVNVEYVGMQGTGEQRLATLLQSGDAPESFTGNIGQVGNLFIEGQLQPVNSPTQAIAEQCGEVIAPVVLIDGKNYVIPHGVYTSTTHYRKDILDQLSLDPPQTWEELRNAAQAIEEDGDIQEKGYGVSAVKAGQSASQYALFYLTNGGWYYDWNEDRTGAELWFPEDKAIETLEFLVQMSEYSPDPTTINWGPWLSYWAGKRLAMGYHLNGWGGGVAANAGVTDVAENTGIVPMQEKSGVEPLARSSVTVDGHPVLSVADNVGGMFELAKYMYRTPAAASPYYLNEPTRFIPAYHDIMDADAYRNAQLFQDVPNLLDLNIQSRDEMAPLAAPSDRFPETTATVYLDSFFIIDEMMNNAIVSGQSPQAAVTEAVDRTEQRLKEGRQK